jgi:hypothetical protein
MDFHLVYPVEMCNRLVVLPNPASPHFIKLVHNSSGYLAIEGFGDLPNIWGTRFLPFHVERYPDLFGEIEI